MAIDVEVRLVAVHALAHVIGQPADGEDVAGAVETRASCSSRRCPAALFLGGVEARVVRLERVRGHAGSMINEISRWHLARLAFGQLTVGRGTA